MNTTSHRVLSIGLSIDEGKLVLEALAECPFKHVYELIGTLNRQANECYAGESARQDFSFSEHELSLTIRALGELPFTRVHALMEHLNRQMLRQLAHPGIAKVPAPHVET